MIRKLLKYAVALTLIAISMAGATTSNPTVPDTNNNGVIQQQANQAHQDIHYANQELEQDKQKLNRDTVGIVNIIRTGNPDSLQNPFLNYTDSSGNPATLYVQCDDGYKECRFLKQTATMPITTNPIPSPASPQPVNTPTASTSSIVKAIAGLIYVFLTIYLFILASSNLLRREILFFVVDLFIWSGLTTVLYVLWQHM